MKRRYSQRSFLERCADVQRAFDQPALTTDVIIGFPGETDADFDETCAVVRDAGFCKIHIFSFSPREGTPATALPGRVNPHVVNERRQRLLQLEAELARRYCRSLIGRRLDVLVEATPARQANSVRGTSCRHVSVEFPGIAAALVGKRVGVRIERLEGDTLVGVPDLDKPNDVSTFEAAPPSELRRFALPLLPAMLPNAGC
jgi:threonylcarbamoyladenosine tRNA methylthiotransferase MtaB